jgi:hypothetical protein
MRIRSIRPEFWSSEDIAALDIPTRLLFIGLWSYVDDNGVGRDVEKLIRSELFPLDDDPRETLATVSRGLQHLADGGQITRYMVDGKPFLHVTAWDTHQKVDRPGKSRYPLPTRGDVKIRETPDEPSRIPRETPATGEGEKGRRGEGEKKEKTSSNAAAFDAEFDRFWELYPRKVGKGQARTAYRKARSKVTVEQIATALHAYIRAARSLPADKVRHPATWLNGEPWHDDPAAIAPDGRPLVAVPAYVEVAAPDRDSLPWGDVS